MKLNHYVVGVRRMLDIERELLVTADGWVSTEETRIVLRNLHSDLGKVVDHNEDYAVTLADWIEDARSEYEPWDPRRYDDHERAQRIIERLIIQSALEEYGPDDLNDHVAFAETVGWKGWLDEDAEQAVIRNDERYNPESRGLDEDRD